MKIKQRVGDFRVRELLDRDVLVERGEHRVYRVTKRKLTTPEAARILADEVGVDAAQVGVVGFKDRQGITIQHMSVPAGRKVRVRTKEVAIEPIGFATRPLASDCGRGNAFELVVRALEGKDVRRLRMSLPEVRDHGVVNYFDDQRFGNVSSGQGWIAKELMFGRYEDALRSLLTSSGERDDDRARRFKRQVAEAWGNWRACRDAAGRYGEFHSVFEHLAKRPDDFAGAFFFVSSRLRLIHLYAFQSHVWNRAVAAFLRSELPLERRGVLDGVEGPLVTHLADPPPGFAAQATFRLPGEGLEDVTDPVQREWLEEALAGERMVADQFRIEGVSGFRLKGEDRALIVVPRHLRVRPPEEDAMNPGTRLVRVRFELPRGSYATLVVKRLFAAAPGEVTARGRTRPPRGPVSNGAGEDGGRRAGDGRRPEGRVRDARPRRDDDGQRPRRRGAGRSEGGPGGDQEERG